MNSAQQIKLVGYCGIFCNECGVYKGRITPQLAKDLKELVEAQGFPEWVPQFGGIGFDFKEFQKGLEYFTKENSRCYCQVPCRDGGGIPNCEIRACAQKREFEICFQCNGFPCKCFSWLVEKNPEILEESKEFKKLGMQKWMKQREQKAKRGYVRATKKYYTRAKKHV